MNAGPNTAFPNENDVVVHHITMSGNEHASHNSSLFNNKYKSMSTIQTQRNVDTDIH